MRTKKTVLTYSILTLIVWTTIISVSLFLNIKNEKNQSYQLALNAARANFDKDEALRLWSSRQGGVYVKPSKETPPNPYLAHLKYRDVTTTDGQKLTLMNPAYMIRNIMDDYAKRFGISGRIVGKLALNPNNIADKWESNAIDEFAKGKVKEIVEQRIYKGKEQLRLIKPFYMTKGCVACHGHLGFKNGDLRGAIGISIPLNMYNKLSEKGIRDMVVSHTIIFFLGLIGIALFSNRLYITLKDKKEANDKLNELNKTLDKKVKTRTVELEESYNNLKEAQNKLIEIEKMSSLGSLVAGVAHEINTPVGVSLTGTTQIQYETKKLKKALEDGTLGKNALNHYLDTVTNISDSMYISLRNAATLVKSFKQVAIDQYIENKRDFNLHDYCDEVLLSLHNKTKHSNIQITNAIRPDIVIYSYAGIFSQIITNFVFNSILHAYDENHKYIGKIIIDAYIEDNMLVFTYEDDGKGIDKNSIKKVFDPFFTTKLGEGGSGLGLNIIYNLINHKLDGNIKCESELLKGTKMIINIPINGLKE